MALSKSLLVLACIALLIASAFSQVFDVFGGYTPLAASVRDPRQNRGPVVFPPGPPLGKETSGVRVGASGYGFVPPGGGRGIVGHGPFAGGLGGYNFW